MSRPSRRERPDRRPPPPRPEADERFPSGHWIGFFIDNKRKRRPIRRWLNVHLNFAGGKMYGRGYNRVGLFVVIGQYEVEYGKCVWTLQYDNKYTVDYEGYNEGKGIWGVWSRAERPERGGFRIWPESMPEPSGQGLSELADMAAEINYRPRGK